MNLRDNKNGYWGYMNEEVRDAIASVVDMIDADGATSTQMIISDSLGVAVNQLEVGIAGATFLGGAGFIGNVSMAGLPTHADDTAAGTGGLVQGYLYITPTGEVRAKL